MKKPLLEDEIEVLLDLVLYLDEAVRLCRSDPNSVSWQRVRNLNQKLFKYMRLIGDRTAPFTKEDIKRLAEDTLLKP